MYFRKLESKKRKNVQLELIERSELEKDNIIDEILRERINKEKAEDEKDNLYLFSLQY